MFYTFMHRRLSAGFVCTCLRSKLNTVGNDIKISNTIEYFSEKTSNMQDVPAIPCNLSASFGHGNYVHLTQFTPGAYAGANGRA